MAHPPNSDQRECSLLLFVATPAEEIALRDVANSRRLSFERIKDPLLGEYHWLGVVGNETVIATRPIRRKSQLVMGATGRLGTAARGILFREETGASAIVQVGMAFGVDPDRQKLGDVLVSTELIPYDNRDVKADPEGGDGYLVDYSPAFRQPARPSLLELFLRQTSRGGHSFNIHVGAILSGAARIRSRSFREELLQGVPPGEVVVGGEMEGVGLLAASTGDDDPIWCVVKGISDFADENRDEGIEANRPLACRNAAEFVLSSLQNDSIA